MSIKIRKHIGKTIEITIYNRKWKVERGIFQALKVSSHPALSLSDWQRMYFYIHATNSFAWWSQPLGHTTGRFHTLPPPTPERVCGGIVSVRSQQRPQWLVCRRPWGFQLPLQLERHYYTTTQTTHGNQLKSLHTDRDYKKDGWFRGFHHC